MAPPNPPKKSPPGAAAPTREQSAAYQAMFDYFNAVLFDEQLPPILLNFSRHAGALGFFAPSRWETEREGERRVTHEISLNPSHLKSRSPIDTAATLVHEMVHLWKEETSGTPSRGYHDQVWAAKMLEVGLVPSDTAAPGGKQTGFRMSHYIQPGGRFELAFKAMPKAFLLPWQADEPDRGGGGGGKKPASRNKVKYTCKCPANVWGKPGLNLHCNDCDEDFTEAAE